MHGSLKTCVGGERYMVMGSIWRVLAGGEAERKPWARQNRDLASEKYVTFIG